MALWLVTGVHSTSEAGALSPQQLGVRIETAASYLHRQIEPDGRFTYRRDGLTGAGIDGRYNVLRHAGSLLALAEFHLEHPADTEQAIAINKSFAFLRGCCVAAAGTGVEGLAVWSPPDLVGGSRRYSVAKLGGAGLTLAAMAQWRRMQPESVSLEEMQGLGRFILSMQVQDGRFRSLHSEPAGQHDPDWVSLYYPGEAALGLVLLFEQDGNRVWLESAIDALRALAREREHSAQPPADHWALLATARLWRQDPRNIESALPDGFSWLPTSGKTALAPLMLAHAQSIAAVMRQEQQGSFDLHCARGGFSPDGRSTPTATRLEGLLALLEFMPEGTARNGVLGAVEAGMEFLVNAQWTQGPSAGSFSRVSAACAESNSRSREVRIDYVQHALAAMQTYRGQLQRQASSMDNASKR